MTKSIIKDYYSIISVPITACPDEIKRAYRKQALKLHPDKNKADCAEDKFKDLQEAYEVLSDPIKRKTYDLNRFNPTSLADLFKFPFNNNNNSRASNRNFNGHTPAARNNFGARNHRGGVFRRSPTSFTRSNYTPPPCFTTPPPMSRAPPQSAPPQQQQPPPPPPPPKQDDAILYDVKVNLEEICNGAIRKIRIEREVLGTDGILKKEEEVLPVEIKPGWKEGTKITYSKKGDIFPNRIPADIIFLIKEEQHSLFQRDGSTLRCSLNVPLCDALAGKVNVPNLGGPDFEINFGKPIQPGTVHCILGGGLPDRKNECKRGQLEVTFIVQLPERITPHVLRLAEATREFRKEDVTRWKRNAADEVKSWRNDDSTRGSNSNSN